MTQSDSQPFIDFGKQLRSYRLLAGIATQRELADRLIDAGAPYDYTTISHWESGRRCPPLETLVVLIQILVETGGIENVDQADHLLWLAGKRCLSQREVSQIFGAFAITSSLQDSPTISPKIILPHAIRKWVNLGLVFVVGVIVALVLTIWVLLPRLAWHANEAGLAALVTRKERGEAVQHFERAVRLDPDNATYHYNLANACADLADYECSISEYRAAIKRQPDLILAYNNLGHLLIKLERFDEASELLLVALTYPTPVWLEVTLHKNLGWAFWGLEWYDQALDQLTQARDLQETVQPFDAEAYSRLVEIYRLLGLSHEALQQPVEARRAWWNCLGLATLLDTVEGRKWAIEAQEHLRELEQ